MLYSWNANNEQVLADNLVKMGFEAVWFCKECKHYTRDMELAMEMIQVIHAESIEAVISFNYFPIISMVCNTCQIPYYAWVYDCPHFTLYAKQLALPCNHIGIFDRAMVGQLEGYGATTVAHVPLAVDTAYFEKIITSAPQKERAKYQCDISFVGSLYTDGHNYYDLFSDNGNVATMDAVIGKQCFSYEKDFIREAILAGRIDLEVLRLKMEEQGLALGEDYVAKPEDILIAAVLEKKVTVEERRALLIKIAKHFGNLSFRLYTGSDTGHMLELSGCNKGYVDYHTQMPLVFAGSKVNLNISLRSIHSGIPLRVLDIMACGGFVLSNRQPEMAEGFVEGMEIVTFDSLEECLEKARYYLGHDEEREKIAAAGQRKVREAFSYPRGLERLFL